MNRRSLLLGLAALALAQVSCQRNNGANTLLIAALKDVLPPQVLTAFKRTLTDTARLRVKTQNSSASLFSQLQTWQPAATAEGEGMATGVADWVGLSDYWLLPAIQQQLISPLLKVDELPGWSDLPDVWRSLLQRNNQGLLDDHGSVWATPYRWGHLMMVYSRRRFERLGWQPQAWEDLWRADLQRRISLPNHPRIVLGLVLKAMGYSANDLNPVAHAEMAASLAALRPQVRAYMSEDYLQALIVGDIWLAVGWSTEIKPVLARYRQLAAISPDPGTLLTADVWVKPNTGTGVAPVGLTELDRQWLSYWWQPEVLTPLTLFSEGLAPSLVAPAAISQVEDLSTESVLIPTAEQLRHSEFIVPLPEVAIAAYSELWQQLRRSE